jgi:hypothetical protein
LQLSFIKNNAETISQGTSTELLILFIMHCFEQWAKCLQTFSWKRGCSFLQSRGNKSVAEIALIKSEQKVFGAKTEKNRKPLLS